MCDKKNTVEHSRSDIEVEPFLYTLSLIDGKWKLPILFWLRHKGILRYGELKRKLGKITHKMLSSQLKELETDELIQRKEYPQVPPKVEYSLTELGYSLIPVMDALCGWGHEHIPNNWEGK